jgi:hypothetical protein
MDFRKNRKMIGEAIKEGCRTMAELAHYLRLVKQIQAA